MFRPVNPWLVFTASLPVIQTLFTVSGAASGG
jgi:hypothetical protein